MYEKPAEYKDLKDAINGIPEMDGLSAVVVHVETILTLAEALGLDDEPITVGWVLLSGTPTPDPRLSNLDPDQRRMLANARQFIPLNSRFAWEAALRQYAGIKQKEHLNYDIAPTSLDEQIINARKFNPPHHPEHLHDYQQMLSKPLNIRHDSPHRPEANQDYTFVNSGKAGIQHGKVRFKKEHIEHLEKLLAKDWITEGRERAPFTIRFSDLRETAEFLDQKERELGNENPRWVSDFARIRFRRVENTNGRTTLMPSDMLDIDGFFHMAGIVSSGKTTLAVLIAAYIIRQEGDNRRITFVVGDTSTAIQLVHRLNTWFCSDPATDTPVAVPVLGQSTRAVHLERLLISREYRDARRDGQPHWGERWVNPLCPLESLAEWMDGDGEPIPIGSEPCQRLQAVITSESGKTYVKNHLCPLFAICPSKQMFRDLPDAQIWITTPGALSQSAVPPHLERRPIKFGDLVYEQSDLVIFDEAETIVDWFDRTYAQDFALTNGANGLLDRLDNEVAEYLRQNRAPSPEFQKWLFAERAATKAISSILTLLAPNQTHGLEQLRGWVKGGQFTRNNLSYRLSRRLAGLKEYEQREDLPREQKHEEEEQTRAVVRYFEELDKIANPLIRNVTDSKNPEVRGAYALAGIMQQMNSAGQDADINELVGLCRDWINAFFPNMKEQLAALKARLEESTHKADRDYLAKAHLDTKVDDLAARLFLTLWVVILDWHLNIVFHEWHRKPAEIRGEQPYQRIPRNLRNILPIPAMGGQFGLYRAPIVKASGRKFPNHLTQFVYVNIGRSYVLNFHRLREDLDGQRGPNVLAMSGTSYLPDSSRFHLQVSPHGVLLADERTQAGLRASTFEFKPFRDGKKKRPISVSGVSDKLLALRNIVQMMLKGNVPGGFPGRVLAQLEQKAALDPANWGDRTRLLMFTNSYTQAKEVALTLQKYWPEMANHIFYLSRGKDDQDYEAVLGNNMQRVDIERFAETDGKILVAPMQSIGRGFNILNNNRPTRLAAFGAVFFLTRYMGQPEDFVAMAQEINRYTIQWAGLENVPPALEAADGLYHTALALRETARKLAQNIEFRRGYASLTYEQQDGTTTDIEPELHITPRTDLAASTAGMIIQAIGRLLRGGVPFDAYFIDAAWSPLTAQAGRSVRENADTSLLQAMIDVILTYSDPTNAVGEALYGDLAHALSCTIGLNDN